MSDDISFLQGIIGGGINVPFASHRRTDNFAVTNNQYLVQHLNQYLHYKARLLANDNNDLDIFYNGARVYHDGTTRNAAYTYSGYIDLNDPGTWSDWIGAWTTATGYGEHDLVGNGGVYYRCTNAHTSGTDADEPGVGANWANYWASLGVGGAFAAAGSYYYLYITTNLTASPQFVLDYLLESSETTL